MHVLWSRAAQTRSACRCGSCLHAATTIARRTTSAASKRRLKFGDLFTACYSTILATAAFADAKVKEERRKEWDRIIADAKAGVPMQQPEGPKDIAPVPAYLARPAFDDCDKSIPAVWDGTMWTAPLGRQVNTLETQLKILNSRLKQPLDASSNNPSSPRLSDIDEEWGGDGETVASPREPLSRTHLDKMEEMVSKLVIHLLLGREPLSPLQESFPSRDDLNVQMKKMVKRVEALQSGNTRLPTYTWLSASSVEQERLELNRSLTVLFEKAASDHSNIDVMLAKICYNLLVSTAPPNVETYNILIGYLSRLRLHGLAQVVVDSFLYDSRFRPKPHTIRLILDHYSAKDDRSGFRKMVNRMRAVDGDMRVKRRALHFLCYEQGQDWALANKVIHRNGYVSQKMSRDSKIFDSLIQGCLKMANAKAAIRHIRSALREGQQVSSTTLRDVVKACLNALDYRNGESLLRALLSQWQGDSIPSSIAYSSDVRFAVHQLLSLCGIDPSPNSKEQLPQKTSRVALQSMLYHMSLQSVGEAVDKSAVLISSLERALGLNVSRMHLVIQYQDSMAETGDELVDLSRMESSCAPRENSYEEFEQALRILQKASNLERLRSGNKEGNAKQARSLKLKITESKLTERKMAMQRQQLPVLYNKLSDEWKMKYDGVIRDKPNILRSERLALLIHFSRREDIAGVDQTVEKPALIRAPEATAPKKWHETNGQVGQLENAATTCMGSREESFAKEQHSKSQHASHSKQPRQKSSHQILLASPILDQLSRTTQPLLPLAPAHEPLEAAAG